MEPGVFTEVLFSKLIGNIWSKSHFVLRDATRCMCQDMTQKSSLSTLSGKHKQLLIPSHGIFFFAGGFTEPSPLTREHWWWSPSWIKTRAEWIFFIIAPSQGLSEYLWGVCIWVEGMGFLDIGLETKNSQEICAGLLMSLCSAILYHACISVPGMLDSPEVPTTENSLYEKQKITKICETLMQIPVIFFVCSACQMCTLLVCQLRIDHNRKLWSVALVLS